METLRIAFVYDVIYPWVKGGVERRIYELARRLSVNHEVHVYGYKLWKGKSEIEREGIHYHGTVRVNRLYYGSRRSVTPPLIHSIALLSEFRGERFDVIDCQASPYLPAHSLRLAGLENVLITWHEFWGDYWFDYLGKVGIIGKIAERGLFSFERHISVSQKTRTDLFNSGLRKLIHLVPNGIDTNLIHSLKPSPLESDFLFVGRLIPEKGVDFLLHSLALLKRELPDFRVIIVGDGPEKAKLELLARKLGIEKNTTFTGFLGDYRDVLALMKASKVFAFPSRREGFGMVVLEAMASGIPVVTMNHPMNASRYLMESGRDGFVADVSLEGFAEALLTAYHNSKKLGTFAQKRAERYDWDRIVKVLIRVYRGD
ncbi:glycosyltransferase family 4 protein [Thermococcus sp.]|uniref:glycosyltransferase family 4 protein n=1 Tax=Thermococcus sp. TaxID=35749 RepID=UPI00261FF80D|nr:glycosyltransferase family 4 protein [Thermococcus sp.]